MADRDESPQWKASKRSSGGACVELLLGATVSVRDSRNPDGPVLCFDQATFNSFLTAVRVGRFDCDH